MLWFKTLSLCVFSASMSPPPFLVLFVEYGFKMKISFRFLSGPHIKQKCFY